MKAEAFLTRAILDTWKTSNRITVYLIENLPPEIWTEKVPGYRQKTVGMVMGHLHNTRCMWLKSFPERFELTIPESVDRYRVSPEELAPALHTSSEAMLDLLKKGIDSRKNLPGFSLDVVHFLNYMIAHEAHHRGQITMVARQLDTKLPDDVVYGLWHWSKRAGEVRDS